MFKSYRLFGTDISTYWTMFFVGLVGMIVLLILRRKRYRFSILGAVLFNLLLAVFGIAGAKLLYILENLDMVKLTGLTLGGLSFYGSVWLILLLIPLAGLAFKLKPLDSLDAAAIGVTIMIAFLRVGCYFNGCCGGITVRTATGSFTYPTQMIESIGDFIILFLLLEWEKKNNCDGKLYPGCLVMYGILRFIVEFMRDTPKGILGLSNAHGYSLASIVIGGGYLLYRRFRNRSYIDQQS